jgi:chemotaxis protein CheD
MRHTVGVADMKISGEPGDVLVTHALGSCLGIAVHDPIAQVGGLLHVMMPQARINPAKAEDNPCMFVDAGVPRFFQLLYNAGVCRGRLVAKVAGGASVTESSTDRFNIGQRNILMLRKLLWKNSILLSGEDVGGHVARTMYLEIGSGRVWLHAQSQEIEL